MKSTQLIASLLFCLAMAGTATTLLAANKNSQLEPASAEAALRAGNERFAAGHPSHPNQDTTRRDSLASGQTPFATVIACSDSRVSPEFLFDQGIGDLFVIRVAGNVADTDEIGSIEYGVGHLQTPLLVVLGHTRCGAVTAVAHDHEVHGSIPQLVDNIAPAVARVKGNDDRRSRDDLVTAAVKENVWVAIEDLLARSGETRSLIKAGSLRAVGAIYDIETGRVEWLGEHPKQSELLNSSSSFGHVETDHIESGAEHVELNLDVLDMKPAETAILFWAFVGLAGTLVSGFTIFLAAKLFLPKWRVGTRLGAGFAGMAALVLVAGAIGFKGMIVAVIDFEDYRADSRRTVVLSEIDIAFLEAEIAAKDFASSGTEKSRAILFEELQSLKEIFERVPTFFDDPHHLSTLADVEEELKHYENLFQETSIESGIAKRNSAIARMDQIADRVDHTLVTLTNEVIENQTNDEPVILSELHDAKAMVAITSLASVLIGILLSATITRSIVKPLMSISQDLQNGAHQTAVAASQVSSSSQTLAQGSGEQAASVEEASANLVEIDGLVSSISDSIQEADDYMKEVQRVVEEGMSQMSEMSKAMNDIRKASDEVGNIVKIIDDIAFQTNVLALNASVEAARAGDAGAGFSVVADEVRNLAKRSADATRDTATQIEDTIATTRSGVELANKLQVSLANINSNIANIVGKTHELASSAKEQRSSIGQLNIAMQQIDVVGQQNASISEESAAAAEELSSQSVMLHEAVHELREMIAGASSTPNQSSSHSVPTEQSETPSRNRLAQANTIAKRTATPPLSDRREIAKQWTW